MKSNRTPPDPALFSLRDLIFSYGADPVLTVGSLDIDRGKTTVFIGENGSGKTTLLKLLNGLLKPVRGSLEYNGSPLRDDTLRILRLESVLVHQDPYLFTGTVFGNVAYGLKIRKLGKREIHRRVAEALETVNCGGFEHRRASELSGGEKQRVAAARALVLDPEIIFLDEPTANIDPEFVPELETLIRRLAEQGKSVIVSSHHLPFAYRTGDVLLNLNGGSPSPVPENVLKGKTTGRDDYFLYFDTAGKTLKCPARKGEFTTAVISRSDIILSRGPIESSAQNCFAGTVAAVEQRGRTAVVTLDCGFPLRSEVTSYSVDELEITEGKNLTAVFKSAAVKLY